MPELSPQAQSILDVMWFDYFETVGDKRSLAADIIRAIAKQSIFADVSLNKTIEVVPVDILLAIANELETFNTKEH